VSSADVVTLTHTGTKQEIPVSTSSKLQIKHISWHCALLCVKYQYRNPYFKSYPCKGLRENQNFRFFLVEQWYALCVT